MTQTFVDNVLIDGAQDTDQLRVQGHSTQTQSLQTWETSAATLLAEMTGDGRLVLGDDLGTATPDSLIEAHRSDTSITKPKRGFHALGQISNTLTEITQWVVQEIEIRGANPLSALHTALRVRATNMNTGTPASGGEIRAADIEAINDTAAGNVALPMATALQVGVTNAVGKTITRATGLHVQMNNSGTITTPYAIFTEGDGVTHLDDYLGMKRPAAMPGTPVTDYLRIYSKADGKLYAKNWLGIEYDLTGVGGGSASVAPSLVNGRLTLTSATPVTTSDVIGATTLYFTPFHGNQVALFNGSSWVAYAFSQCSLSLSGLAANTNYDIFLYDNAGTLTLEAVAWTNNTTRATALILQDGVYVKSGATSRRYLGSIRTTATTGQTEDSAKKRLIFNEYHRFARKLSVIESTGQWTYSTNAWRSANNNNNNRVEVIIGNPGIFVSLNLMARATGAGSGGAHGIGYDTTTSTSADIYPNLSNDGHVSVHLVHAPAVGYHYYQWVENARGNSVTTFSGVAGAFQSGIVGEATL